MLLRRWLARAIVMHPSSAAIRRLSKHDVPWWFAWLAGCRRLRIRYDRDSERFFAFAMLGCARLCYNRLPRTVPEPARAP